MNVKDYSAVEEEEEKEDEFLLLIYYLYDYWTLIQGVPWIS